MLRLTGAFRYFFCSDVVSFKCRHNGLASYIKCSLQRDPSNGDIYIFKTVKCYRMSWPDFVRMLEGIVPGKEYFRPQKWSEQTFDIGLRGKVES